MKPFYKSTKLIDWLREMYPGKWRYRGGSPKGYVWQGDHFSVVRENGKLTRTDTGETLVLPEITERSNYIHNILSKKFGGKWVRYPFLDNNGDSGRAEWLSFDHPFKVYTSSESYGKSNRRVYRRSDTKEVVYRSERRSS